MAKGIIIRKVFQRQVDNQKLYQDNFISKPIAMNHHNIQQSIEIHIVDYLGQQTIFLFQDIFIRIFWLLDRQKN